MQLYQLVMRAVRASNVFTAGEKKTLRKLLVGAFTWCIVAFMRRGLKYIFNADSRVHLLPSFAIEEALGGIDRPFDALLPWLDTEFFRTTAAFGCFLGFEIGHKLGTHTGLTAARHLVQSAPPVAKHDKQTCFFCYFQARVGFLFNAMRLNLMCRAVIPPPPVFLVIFISSQRLPARPPPPAHPPGDSPSWFLKTVAACSPANLRGHYAAAWERRLLERVSPHSMKLVTYHEAVMLLS